MFLDAYRLANYVILAAGALGMLLVEKRLRGLAMLCVLIGGTGAIATVLIEQSSAEAHVNVDPTYQFVSKQMRSCLGEGFFISPTTQDCKSRVYVIVDHSSLNPQERAKAYQIIEQW